MRSNGVNRAVLRFLLAPLAAAATLAGVVRRLLGGQPRLPAVATALVDYFAARGLCVEPRLVNPLSSEAIWTFELRLNDCPRPMVVSVYLSASHAERAFRSIGDRPSHAFPSRNGHLVMVLPFWDHSVPELDRATDAFASFKHVPPGIFEP